jgi:predicted extracellular nuclease
MKDNFGFRLALVLSLAGVLGLGACRSSSGGDDDDDVNNPDGGNGDGQVGGDTIFAIQQGSVAEGTVVDLKGVVVTAVDAYGSRFGGVYVQDPAGGAFSGVFVYNPTGADEIRPGDLVEVTGGAVEEFAYSDGMGGGDTSGRSLTELSPPQGGTITITKTGDGTIPTPPIVDANLFATDDTEAEKWEGVPITLQGLLVGTAPHSVSSSDPTIMQMDLTGPVIVENGLTELLPETYPVGTCLTSITGIGDYFFDYKIQPRSAADIVTGTGCPAENTEALCSDAVDNDDDSIIDCDDSDCDPFPVCSTEVTVASIQDGTTTMGPVSINDGVVLAVGQFKYDGSTEEELRVWVGDSGISAPYNGVLVYRPALRGTTASTLVPGDVVDVGNAAISEHSGLTELASADFGGGDLVYVTKVGSGQTVTATSLTFAQMMTPTAEMYEGTLVTVTGLTVTEVDSDFGQWSVTGIGAIGDLLIDDTMAAKPMGLALGDCYTITGIVDQFTDYKLLPRSAADLVPTPGACP